MRSDYTSNGMHKDDPTNPQSHWNDWTIDRDGNKMEEYKHKHKEIEVDKEIESINDDFINLTLRINVAMLTTETEQEKTKALIGFCESLIGIVEKQDKLIKKLRKHIK
ncbi:MAG: hypothetical protein ACRCTZ_09520 [Sarcina sp.]